MPAKHCWDPGLHCREHRSLQKETFTNLPSHSLALSLMSVALQLQTCLLYGVVQGGRLGLKINELLPFFLCLAYGPAY